MEVRIAKKWRWKDEKVNEERKLLKFISDKPMTQWVKERAWCRGENNPARPVLIFTKEMEIKNDSENQSWCSHFQLKRKEHQTKMDCIKKITVKEIKRNLENFLMKLTRLDYTKLKTKKKNTVFMEVHQNGGTKMVLFLVIKEKSGKKWFIKDKKKQKKQKNEKEKIKEKK